MGVRFEETMSGTYTANDGMQAPIVFTVTATAEKVRAFVTGDPIRLEGTMTVGGVCRDAPATGTLEVKVLSTQTIVYTLAFCGDDGATYRYRGQKDIKALDPLNSMTTLRGELMRQDEKIGTGELSFSLRDIPEFMKSFQLA